MENKSLHAVIKEIQSVSGKKDKQKILVNNRDNLELKEFLRCVYDPAINFYQKKAPKATGTGSREFSKALLEDVVDKLSNRKITGNLAKQYLQDCIDTGDEICQYLLTLLISRSIGAGIADNTILSVWPNLWFSVPYMRCGLMDKKARKHFESLSRIIVEKKADGTFAYLKKLSDGTATAFSRAGSTYPQWLVQRLAKGLPDTSYVYVGELLIYKNGKLLDRQTGNGIYNSILKNGDEDEFKECDFVMEAWDVLPLADFEAGYSKLSCEYRLTSLEIKTLTAENINVIEYDIVDNLAAAYRFFAKKTQDGFEGAIVKDPNSPWKDHTSPFNIKLKIEFVAEYEITAVNEGEGKAKSMMGSVSVKSREGKIKSDVGTGWSDAQRIDIWNNKEAYIKQILSVKANEIIGNRDDSESFSLFLPVALDIRLDKTQADTYDMCVDQFNAAKEGKTYVEE